MTLASGVRLGPYEILTLVGAGGMGEVYRARDTKLGRDVALKILPSEFMHDSGRAARFRREAQLLAALNHPHIAAIYGLEDANGSRFLVLELVEGETLAQRLRAGPLPLTEALTVARQVAEALQAAHEKGIIHRDLKPANIALTADGQVKVLDFGLAIALEAEPTDISNSPTLSLAATQAGVILGTAAYMSPEQAKGRVADKRSDVWAFGCVLYEMLTGKRAFEGEDLSDILAAVLRGEPNWTALPPNVPSAIGTLVKRCLEKDRTKRTGDISTALFLIEELASIEQPAADPPTPLPVPAQHPIVPWTTAGVIGVAVVVVVMLWAPWRKAAVPAPLRLSAALGADASLVVDRRAAASAVLSPDGLMLAFVAQKSAAGNSQLYVRRLEQLQATPLAGTEDARNPFFSPDGQWIAFFAGQTLKKVSVTGGVVIALCDAPNGMGGTWAEDGRIAFSAGTVIGGGAVLQTVSSAGGKPESLTTLAQGEVTQRWPQVLPGAKAVLYTGHSAGNTFNNANIVIQPLPSGPRRVLVRGGYYGRYLHSGHLVCIHDATLFAAPFDLERLEVVSEPVPMLENVGVGEPANVGVNGGAQFAGSNNGTLVYLPGGSSTNDAPIAWMDREGKTTPLRATPANWGNPRFSPDGRQLAMYINDGKQSDVWVYDWARDTLSRVTFDAADDLIPAWTPDGRRIAFASTRGDKSTSNLYWQRADGSGEIQRLTESKNNQYPLAWHPSGKFLAFLEANPKTGRLDLMILPMEGDEATGRKPGKPSVFLSNPFSESSAAFSPDGRWLAYSSTESGRGEVYVRPFPGPGGKWQISTNSGSFPIWSRTRRELFYEADLPKRIMVASYIVEGDSFRVEKPRPWADRRYMPRLVGQDFDLHPDGERVALALASETETAVKQDKIVFIFNFFDELRRLAPVEKR